MKNQVNNKSITISLWIVQSLLGAMFIMTGAMKLSQPIAELSAMLPWTKDIPEMFVRLIGSFEILGGIGLIFPGMFRIKPILTPVAAVGIVLVQVSAVVFHISRGEMSILGMNFFVIVVALFIAWGRLSRAPIPAKA